MASHYGTDEKDKKKRRRRVMKEFQLSEISIVDRPAQAHARIAIMKRADDNAGRDVQKVLPSPRAGESQNEFVSRFMGSEEAKREFPKQDQRVAVAIQRYKSTKKAEGMEKRLALTTYADGHAHMIVGVQANMDGMGELRAGKTSYVDGHAHDWIMDDAGNLNIADANGHNHGISVLVQKGEDTDETLVEGLQKLFTDLLPEEGALANLLSKGEVGEETAAEAIGNNTSKGSNMTKQETAADKAVDQAKFDEIQKRNQRLEQIVKLSADEKTHFDGLNEQEQETFLQKSEEDRREDVRRASDKNAVVYKSIDGTEYRKSDDQRLVALAKRADEDRKELARERALAKRADLEKRAGEVLKNLPGDVKVRADILGAIETLPEADRTAALEVLQGLNKGLAKAFESAGTSGGSVDQSAQDGIEAIAKRMQEKDPSLTPEQAYASALETEEGRALFLEMRS